MNEIDPPYAPPTPPRAGGEPFPRIPGYRFQKRLGAGGMATVYLATQESLDRPVSIKVMARETLLDETSKPILASAGKEAVQDFRAVVDEFIQRKERFFPNNRRFIVSYELSETKHSYHLLVASTL